MTLKGHITQLVDEAVGKRKRGDPQEKRQSSKEKTVIPGNTSQKQSQNWYYSVVIIKTLCKFHGLKYHFIFCVFVNFQLLVQFSY